MKLLKPAVVTVIAILGASIALAGNETGTAVAAINTGDTAFMMVSAALVLFMTPGLAFFYGGMVRRKNILSVLMQCYVLMCLLSLQWILWGYSLAFSEDIGGGLLGGLSWIGLRGVGVTPSDVYATTIPHQLFMIFQGMFAVITPALIIGAVVDRIKFWAFFVFMILWSTIIYDPVAHWVWSSNGWLFKLGALDFAGGAVVHINAGIAALVFALLIGKRNGFDTHGHFPPHHLPFTVLGTGLLWFGWFGFNAGSALGASSLAVTAFVTTNTATAAAGLMWAILEWRNNGAPTMLGVATGAVAGLVSITPACGFVGPMSAIAIGGIGSAVCFAAVVYLKPRFGYDDSLDVFGVHGIGGIWGALATGIFSQKIINPAGADGLLFGNPRQFAVQLLSVAVTLLFSGVLTFVLYKIVDATIGMRVSEEDEILGLDMSQHKETAYTVLE